MSPKRLLMTALTSLCLQPVWAQAQTQTAPDILNYLRFVDLRDLLNNGTELSGTSNLIIKALEDDTQKLQILGSDKSNIHFFRSGPLGPKGGKIQSNGKSVYAYSQENDGSQTRTNTVLGAELEDIQIVDTEKSVSEAQIFDLKMILFIHDENRAPGDSPDDYYFRRVNLRVDWTIPKDRARERIQVGNDVQEISLSQTNFHVAGDLLERKVILEDTTNNIIKVFPIGVGSFDVRTAPGMDNHVSLMTYEFQDAVLKKTSIDKGSIPNVQSRIYPSYYRGRPFIAIYDKEKGYRQIGMHYQIDASGLRRGFVSHGCIRVEDKYLYQLDVIVNEGVQDEIPARFVYNLEGYDNIFHPMPKMDSKYNIVNYSELAPSSGGRWTKIKCPHSSYNVRYYGDRFHTIADSDCLTRVSEKSGHVYDVLAYMKGLSEELPQTYTSWDNHVPTSSMSTEGGEAEAGNVNSENTKDYQQFMNDTSLRGRVQDALFGNRPQEPRAKKNIRYIESRCRTAEQKRTNPNCKAAIKDLGKGGGLY